MEENTEICEDVEVATIEDTPFIQEIAKALAIGIVSGAGSLAGLYAFGFVASKVEAFKERRAAKKAAANVIETPESDN